MRLQQGAPPQASAEATSDGAIPSGLVGPFELRLAATAAAPAAARAALTAWMAGHVSATLLADAQLLVSELVSNSVRHADAPRHAGVSVSARLRDDALRLEVGDPGTSGSIVLGAPDVQRGGGFGLHVVDVLARRWGVNRDAGTRVWAELPFAAAG
jgi:anti-sigma regulatory factor (Ser/Thr protein kinase)